MSSVVENVMTTGTRQRLHEELGFLLARRRTAILEYAIWYELAGDAAEEAQSPPPAFDRLERRIAEVHALLDESTPHAAKARVPGAVGVGSRVTVRWGDGTEEEYTIVGPAESDPRAGRISADSPVGETLLGRRCGDRVEVATPGGDGTLAIVAIA